jgi:hypothetical protein
MTATVTGCRRSVGSAEWDWINAARMPWMTFAESTSCQYAALGCAIFADRFGRIIGAAGIKAAILAQKRTNAKFVQTQQQQ